MHNFSGEAGNLASHLTKSFFQKKFPFVLYRVHDPSDWARAERLFVKWKAITIVLLIVFFMAMPLFYSVLLHQLYEAVYRALCGKNELFYPADWALFSITGLPLMLATISYPIEWVQRIFLRRDYDLFEDYYDYRQGYVNKKAAAYMGRIFLFVTIVTMPYTFGTRIVLKPGGMDYKGADKIWPVWYNYSDIRAISFIRNDEDRQGTITPGRVYRIFNKDGTNWSTGFYFGEADQAAPFVRDLASRSGIMPDTIQLWRFQR